MFEVFCCSGPAALPGLYGPPGGPVTYVLGGTPTAPAAAALRLRQSMLYMKPTVSILKHGDKNERSTYTRLAMRAISTRILMPTLTPKMTLFETPLVLPSRKLLRSLPASPIALIAWGMNPVLEFDGVKEVGTPVEEIRLRT